MSKFTDDIEQYIKDSGAFPGFIYQQGRWQDDEMNKNDRFITIIKTGGLQAQEWARYPTYRILVTGARLEAWDNALQTGLGSMVSNFIDYTTITYKSGCHGNILATEAVQLGRTDENRPVYEINLTARTK